jgi:hypothetical protein
MPQPSSPKPITIDLVLQAALACTADGLQPSQRNIRAKIGGSFTTIGRHLHSLRADGRLPASSSSLAQARPALAYACGVIEQFQIAITGIRNEVRGKVDISAWLVPVERFLPTDPDESAQTQRSDTRYVIPEIQDSAIENPS